jgi:hypothetical protein
MTSKFGAYERARNRSGIAFGPEMKLDGSHSGG